MKVFLCAKKIYKRELYLKKIRPFYDDDMIKVITGIRRCGKSYLLLSIIDELIENVVYTYLKSNRYEISIGKIKDYEVDFICRDNFDDYYYIQVAMTILSNIETEDREYRPFEIVKDNYPKYLLTLDQLIQKRFGVLHKNLISFLLKNERL